MRRDDVTFDSWGTRCAAWLYWPGDDDDAGAAGARGGSLPCVVMAAGFAGVREARLDAFAERFAEAGLPVLLFDYRGFGASEGAPRQLLSIPMQLADWAAAIAYARTLDGVDPEKIVLWGTSFSGGHVLATAARDQRVAAVIAQTPFVDGLRQALAQPLGHALRLTVAALRDELAARRGRPPFMVAAAGPPGSPAVMNTPDAEAGMRAILPPASSWRNEVAARICMRLTAYRPGRHAKAIRCPLLVTVGDADVVTLPDEAEKAVRLAPRGELLRYAGMGHFDVYLGDYFERAVGDQLAFLAQHLLAAPAAAAPPAATA
jgi:pimeloyl-ACP methyl ester carboxylesterase